MRQVGLKFPKWSGRSGRGGYPGPPDPQRRVNCYHGALALLASPWQFWGMQDAWMQPCVATWRHPMHAKHYPRGYKIELTYQLQLVFLSDNKLGACEANYGS